MIFDYTRVFIVSIHRRLKAAADIPALMEEAQKNGTMVVSIHSRLKAAGYIFFLSIKYFSFNTQPPEGG